MRGINKVLLIGNLGKDPVIHYIEGNIPVAKFPLATTEIRKDKNGNSISETEWHTVVLWRGLAKLAEQYLKKGSLIYLEGKLHTRNWEDKNNNYRCQTEIIGDNLVMLDKRKEQEMGEWDGTELKNEESPEVREDNEDNEDNEEMKNDTDEGLRF